MVDRWNKASIILHIINSNGGLRTAVELCVRKVMVEISPDKSTFDFDETGKIDLNFVYNRPAPVDYFRTLSRLGYVIPGLAEPLFRASVAALRKDREQAHIQVLDVGCSYGINGALIRSDLELSDIVAAYEGENTPRERRALAARDRCLLANHRDDPMLTVVGLDTAEQAIAYATAAQFINAGITTNLEGGAPEEADARLLSTVDLVISTGAIGYVGETTFDRLLSCCRRPPWLALFALRMFPFAPIAEVLRRHGHECFRLEGRTFRQRRFANRDEAEHTMSRLAEVGIDPTGKEDDGWYHAEFFFARPAAESGPLPVPGLRPF